MSTKHVQPFNCGPYTVAGLFFLFHRKGGSINKHLLIIYSIVVVLNAQRVQEIDVGSTTRALRSALKITGGCLFSFAIDPRFKHLLDQPDPKFKVVLGRSDECFKNSNDTF
ncbi:MAG: hypothetical protein ABIL02_03115 [candidate division WOR-3 bacterium]